METLSATTLYVYSTSTLFRSMHQSVVCELTVIFPFSIRV